MDNVFPVRLLSQLRPLLIGFRKSKGLTQRELSARLGVTQQTYARLEANPSKASFQRLYNVLNILGVEISLREGANKQVISSQVDSLIKISRIWADFFPANTSNQPI
ncbi:helix-turn-helix domain-containing protein [Escherichia coli]|nr:helix-turn-helix transcriptional regulator [Escherichia coli]